jgi:pimeloyl-ACP methyl ester carboxylesterase
MFGMDWFERWRAAAEARPALAWLGRDVDLDVCIRIDQVPWFLRVEAGRIASIAQGPFHMRRAHLTFSAPTPSWERFWRAIPPRGFHDVFAMSSYGYMEITGDVDRLLGALAFLKTLLAVPRAFDSTPEATDPDPPPGPRDAVRFEPIRGGYVHYPIEGRSYRVYYEEAGSGIPLLCLHTAGSHSNQFRHLMCDTAITDRFRVIAFDLPWHGKSSVPDDWMERRYQLTPSFYVGAIVGFAEALGLERPVVLGCSMGGRVVFPLAADHGERFRAVIGLEATDEPSPWWDDSWLGARDFASGEFCAALVSGLCAPQSPPAARAETLWHYQQGGSYVFEGDMHFFRADSRFREHAARIDTNRCAVWLLTGEYDYSCRAENSAATAARIPGAVAAMMPGLGHFPMIENPARFRSHLLPVLDEIHRRSAR